MGRQVVDLRIEEIFRKVRRVLYRLKGPEGYYLIQQYEQIINEALDKGDYDKILNLKIRYDPIEMPMRDLRAIARQFGIKYIASLTRTELVREIENASRGTVGTDSK